MNYVVCDFYFNKIAIKKHAFAIRNVANAER